MASKKRIALEMLLITLGSSALGLTFNQLREEGLPLQARYPYEIFIPCPDARTEVEAISVEEVPKEGVLFLDARSSKRFEQGHIPGARSLPYDDLFDPPEAEIKALLKAQARMILVYGELDGALDTGRMMAADLAAKGLRGVRPLKGGAEAWAASGRAFEGLLGEERE